jgi:hypothetical protein
VDDPGLCFARRDLDGPHRCRCLSAVLVTASTIATLGVGESASA